MESGKTVNVLDNAFEVVLGQKLFQKLNRHVLLVFSKM